MHQKGFSEASSFNHTTCVIGQQSGHSSFMSASVGWFTTKNKKSHITTKWKMAMTPETSKVIEKYSK